MNSDLKSFDKIEQKIGGSRKISNYIIGGMLTIGGIGFFLASLSSYTGRDLLPLGNPSTLLFIPQGIIMGAYGCLLYTSPSPRDGLLSRMPSSA